MDNYITLFEKFIGVINWKLLQKYAFKLNTDYKKRSFFTHHHLAAMIYFHLCEHDGLRDLNQGMLEQMGDIFPSISLSSLSNHNNNRNWRVFIPIMNDLTKTSINTLTKDERLARFGSVKMIDSTTISICLTFLTGLSLEAQRLALNCIRVLMHSRSARAYYFFKCCLS